MHTDTRWSRGAHVKAQASHLQTKTGAYRQMQHGPIADSLPAWMDQEHRAGLVFLPGPDRQPDGVSVFFERYRQNAANQFDCSWLTRCSEKPEDDRMAAKRIFRVYR